MRRILATSIAAAIPAVLPMHMADARTKPAPPPTVGAHARPGSPRGHGAHGAHGRPAPAPANDTHGRPDPRANDVQVSADDDGGGMQGGQEPQGTHEPRGPQETHSSQQSHDAHQSHHAHQAEDAQQSHGRPASGPGTHGRPASRPDANSNTNNQPRSRPGTGADTGYSIPGDTDADPALPPEALSALNEVGQTGNQGTNGDQGANQTGDQGARQMTAAVGRAANPAAGTTQLMLRTTAGTNAARSVMLRCDPPGGTHPKAADACADVAKSQGDLKQLPASTNPRACFMIYAPVTVSAQGNWRGQPVQFTAQFPNTCVMRDKTGSIFDF
jgi:hypothetical protein